MTIPMVDHPASQAAPVAAPDESREPYRILLPLDRDDDHNPELLRFAAVLAEAHRGEVLELHVVTPYDRDADRWALPPRNEEILASVPHRLLTHKSETEASGILEVARREACDLILLHWRGRPHALRNKLGHILDPVIEDAPCDVAMLQGDLAVEGDDIPLKRILLASAGGPHSIGAARMAFGLARRCQGTVTLITVIPAEADAEMEAAANEMLADLMTAGNVTEEETDWLVERRVIRHDKVEPAIVAAAQNHDMVFFGASNDSVANQLLMGSLVERLGAAIPQPVIIVKRYRGLTQYWLRRMWRWLDEAIPNVAREERLDTYKRLRRGARATTDFYVLIVLSSVIAAMGLLLNSGAVIIGAMLVAPLMTPILGLGMGVVLGDSRLLTMAASSTLRGVLLAIGTAVLLTWLTVGVATLLTGDQPSFSILLQTEIQGRTGPTLLDLMVALAAGAAGSYSYSRRNLGAALPGVAIAAALVPPLCVVGIGLAAARWAEAGGALLLFTTNLIAITGAAALINMMFGFFPQEEDIERQALLRRGFLVILALLFLVAVPLTTRFQQTFTTKMDNLARNQVEDTIRDKLQEENNLSLLTIDWSEVDGGNPVVGEASEGAPRLLRVYVLSPRPVPTSMATTLQETIAPQLGADVSVRLLVIRTGEAVDDAGAAAE